VVVDKSRPGSRRERAVDPDVVATIRGAVTRLARQLRTQRGEAGLPAISAAVLSNLRTGPRAPSEIAAAERVTVQSLTAPLRDLDRAGLIARETDATDARRSMLRLTEAGAVALRDEVRRRDEWLTEALSGLSDLEVEVVRLAALVMERLA
jgi:DNA-binding MarR family transcriptional regulator